MESLLNKKVTIETQNITVSGELVNFENGILKLKVDDLIKNIHLNEVLKINLEEDNQNNDSSNNIANNSLKFDNALSEKSMYELFYDAFNIYGPTEDQFIFHAALNLSKFYKLSKECLKFRIIVSSDDIFGRIGLCCAKILYGRLKELSISITCEIKNLNTLKYLNILKNLGVNFDKIDPNEYFAHTIFAGNRRSDFSVINDVEDTTIIVLDLPEEILPFKDKVTGVGFGFIPEHYKNSNKGFYFYFDMTFCEDLSKIYGIEVFSNAYVTRRKI